jgi:predicted nucleic acid-binding protein
MPLAYWDTCIFIAWLTGETCHKPHVIAGMKDMMQSFDSGELHIATSTITCIEILSDDSDDEVRSAFDNLTKRTNFHIVSVDRRVARVASDIRQYYKLDNIVIKTPDAIHLASAINISANSLYTFDGRKRGGLLRFSGNVASKYLLKIQEPDGIPSLFDDADSTLDPDETS